MAILTFSFDTGAVPLSKITGAFAFYFNYPATIFDPKTKGMIPNPETQDQFLSRMISQYIISIVKTQDINAAVQTANQSVAPIVLNDVSSL